MSATQPPMPDFEATITVTNISTQIFNSISQEIKELISTDGYETIPLPLNEEKGGNGFSCWLFHIQFKDEEAKKLLGFIICKHEFPVIINDFYIKKEWRRCGLGTICFKLFKEQFSEVLINMGTKSISLVITSEEKNLSWLMKQGFQIYSKTLRNGNLKYPCLLHCICDLI